MLNEKAEKAVFFIRGAPQESFSGEAGIKFARALLAALKG